MFQKGQLVQSREHGDYYVVLRSDDYKCDTKPLTGKKAWPTAVTIQNHRLRLIGNNYRPKARKKARK